MPSSREMSSLEKHSPGISPRFFSQKTAQKEPEKKMPSTAAKATMRSANDERCASHHRSAQSAFLATQGIVSMAFRHSVFFLGSRMYLVLGPVDAAANTAEGRRGYAARIGPSAPRSVGGRRLVWDPATPRLTAEDRSLCPLPR